MQLEYKDREFNMKAIAREFHCASCSKVLDQPTIVCENGHTSCRSCRLQASKCAECEGKLIPGLRNLALERMVAKIRNRCPNSICGCRTLLSGEMVSLHTGKCNFYHIDCPLQEIALAHCTWRGKAAGLIEHVQATHGQILVQGNHFDCRAITSDYKLVVHEGEVFLYIKKMMISTWMALVLSAEITPRKFKSIFTLKNSEEDSRGVEESMILTFLVNSINIGISETIGTGRCLIMNETHVENYVRNGEMNMSVTIEKI